MQEVPIMHKKLKEAVKSLGRVVHVARRRGTGRVGMGRWIIVATKSSQQSFSLNSDDAKACPGTKRKRPSDHRRWLPTCGHHHHHNRSCQ
jgi:hypothetical protein